MDENSDITASEAPEPQTESQTESQIEPQIEPTKDEFDEHATDEEPVFSELSLEEKLANLQEVVSSCQGVVADLQNEKHDLKLALQRAQADFVNYQKRALKDKQDAKQQATRSFLEDLIPVLDNIRYSLIALQDAGANEAILDPMLMLNDSFVKILIKHQVEQILPEIGDPFDPEYHQAISVMAGTIPGETVAHIARPGYAIAGQVFRPAEVVVQKA